MAEQKITPFLWFEKDCEEGINFYVSVFNSAPNSKGSSRVVSIHKYPDNIPNAPWPKEVNGKVLTAIFELGGQRFMALDGGPGIFPKGGQVSLLIECDTQEEVDHYWNKLTEGGDAKIQQCGWLSDKYGFIWQVNPKRLGELLSDPDKEKSGRVMQAMLKMKKIVIADLENAAEGK
ncbi:MAG TPA: VOC family protein [Candidatus Limnocylindria bacterium]|nr:VOC family protein [Candidatus Limnocylindria bacterium]